jgi:phosphoribosylaminoimidazole-succinocarboxamide synthase
MPAYETAATLPVPLHRGKVRDVYDLGDRLLLVATDRVSAFDVILPRKVPDKGRILTGISDFWFTETAAVFPNHRISADLRDFPEPFRSEPSLAGRATLVHKARRVDVECVVRGYLAGSGWKEYQRSGTVCGIALPGGMGFCQRLPKPILTPTTKEETHDQPLTPAEARARVGAAVFDLAERAALALFERGTKELARIGILLADTKFEFGVRDGELILIDEALTPDSSRFWPAQGYQVGVNPPSYDKQVLRDYLETLDWKKAPPGPELPPAIVQRVSERYLEVCAKITGRAVAVVTA